ncbi:DUF3221 domain-containing protein [Proteiniborus sp.]|uniref:DUF3221 domain-containing protein n=1 Tax=Proteiniborus sp. TaxID=2079015 RepID=UPI003333E20B
MNYKKLILIALGIIAIALAGCQKNEKVDIRGEITGVDISNDNRIVSIMVEGELEEDTSFDKASIRIDKSTKIYMANTNTKISTDELKEGMKVEAIFDGPVAESYPVQAKAKVIKILEQDKNTEIAKTSNNANSIPLELEESGYTEIDAVLNKQKNIDIIRWAPDKSCVAFLMNNTDWGGQMYLWYVGVEEPVEVQGAEGMICDFIWSPNSEYVVADEGTSNSRTGYVVKSKDTVLLYSMGFISDFFWSPDSKFIAMAKESEVKSAVLTELEGTTDVCLLNIETEETKIIDRGAPEYNLWITSWDNDGILHYVRSYVNEPGKSEELTYKYQ